MSASERYLSPSETARRLGVSPKALRLYERHGLLAPPRTAKGWRVYGPREFAALHRILALRRLGLTLAQIGRLVAERAIGADAVLAAQEDLLARDAARLAKALGLIRAARRKIAAGETLSIDDLINLTRETEMTGHQQSDDLKALFEPLVEKHFSASDINLLADKAYDAEEVHRNWESLIAEAGALLAAGDPATPAAMNLARRWMALVGQFSGGDPALAEKAKNVWSDAMNDPAAAPKLPLSPALFAFVGQAWAHAKQTSRA